MIQVSLVVELSRSVGLISPRFARAVQGQLQGKVSSGVKSAQDTRTPQSMKQWRNVEALRAKGRNHHSLLHTSRENSVSQLAGTKVVLVARRLARLGLGTRFGHSCSTCCKTKLSSRYSVALFFGIGRRQAEFEPQRRQRRQDAIWVLM